MFKDKKIMNRNDKDICYMCGHELKTCKENPDMSTCTHCGAFEIKQIGEITLAKNKKGNKPKNPNKTQPQQEKMKLQTKQPKKKSK